MSFLTGFRNCLCCQRQWWHQYGGSSLPSDHDDVSGTWTVSSGQLRVTGDGLVLIGDPIAAPFALRLRCSTGFIATNGEQGDFRFVFAYEDTDNYWYVRIHRSYASFVVTAFATDLISFHRVVAGVDTQIGSTRTIVRPASDDVVYQLCATPEMLTLYNSNSPGLYYGYPPPAPIPDGRVGFQNVATAIVPEHRVDEVDLYLPAKLDATLQAPVDVGVSTIQPCLCRPYCIGCLDGLFPDVWKAVLGDLPVGSNHAACAGTYLLPGKSCRSTITFTPCGAAGLNSATITVFGGDDISLTLGSTAMKRIRFTLDTASPPAQVIWEKNFDTLPVDCLAFEDLELDYVGSSVNFLGSKVRLSSA